GHPRHGHRHRRCAARGLPLPRRRQRAVHARVRTSGRRAADGAQPGDRARAPRERRLAGRRRARTGVVRRSAVPRPARRLRRGTRPGRGRSAPPGLTNAAATRDCPAVARTPLLRALQRLAEEHATADALGIDADELRGLRAERISRGEFLKRAGFAGAAVAVGPALLARSARAAGAPRIAIVGGGIAGLAAALALADKGVYADVYESSGRLGGRMHSDWTEFGHTFWYNGQQAELCGELIDSNHKTILQLAQRFSLKTVDLLGAQPKGTTDTYWIDGSRYTFDQASKDFQPVHDILQSQVQATGYPTLYNSFTTAGQTFDKM